MLGRPVSDAEKNLHDRIAQMGCVACRKLGIHNTHVSIHHVHGRTKPGCHMHVLPLCEPHHQDNGTAIAVHPWKARWEREFGKQDDLVAQQWEELGVVYEIPQRKAKAINRDKPKKPKKEKAPKEALVQQPAGAEKKASKPKPERPKIDKPKTKISVRKVDNRPKQSFPKATSKISSSISRKISRPLEKPEMTDAQAAYLEERKADQKRIQSDRKAQYLEENKDLIEARKAEAKAQRKKYQADMAQKLKKAS